MSFRLSETQILQAPKSESLPTAGKFSFLSECEANHATLVVQGVLYFFMLVYVCVALSRFSNKKISRESRRLLCSFVCYSRECLCFPFSPLMCRIIYMFHIFYLFRI